MNTENLVSYQMYQPNMPKLPNDPTEASALLRSTIPRSANPITSQLSYGRKAIPNLVKDLSDPKLPVQQRALVCLAELFHSPSNVSQGISERIVKNLLIFLSSQNLTCRQKSSECLKILSSHAIGRNALCYDSITLQKISKSVNDSDEIVRKNIHEIFENASTQQKGVQQMLDSKLFSILISKLHQERLDIQVLILNACYNCIRYGSKHYMPQTALEVNAIETFTTTANQSNATEVQVAACECIMMLSFYHEGKRAASNPESIRTLMKLLSNPKSSVRAAAAGAIMSISIDCDAKKNLVRENIGRLLIQLLDDESELVQLNCIKAITNCAEDYRGRFQLNQSLDKLKLLARNSVNKYVSEAAGRAIEVITWRP